MNLAVDVHYEAERATVAGVWFSAWDACEPEHELLTQVSSVAAYTPGQAGLSPPFPLLLRLEEGSQAAEGTIASQVLSQQHQLPRRANP